MQLKYRPELDGVRGLAVLMAIFYHYSLVAPVPASVKELTSGSYLAVDVFFVLSGYLISRIVLADLISGVFTFSTFYERRIRRIAPAMLLVVLGTIPLGYALMAPEELARFGRSILGIGSFIANYAFYLESSYFAPEAHHMPFLHTWSLSLEEQFYIVFPIVFVFGWALLKHNVIWLFAGLFVASFTYAQLTSGHWPVASFFLPYTRAWEFVAGTFLAYAEYRRSLKGQGRPENQWLMLLGLLVLLASFSLITPAMAHPSFYTSGAILGTGLMIWFGTGVGVGKAFTARPSRFVGHISYSLYLWHMPLFAFWSLNHTGGPNWRIPTALLVVAFAISVLSWKFVEQPCRRKTLRFRKLMYVLLPLWALMVGLGFWFKASDGVPGRLNYPAELQESFKPGPLFHGVTFCHNGIQHPYKTLPLCKVGKLQLTPDFLLVGDSHAWAAMPAFDAVGKQLGVAGGVQTHSGCPHIFGVSVFRRGGVVPTCPQLNNEIYDYVKANNIKTIFMAASWQSYTLGHAKLVQLNPRYAPKTTKAREALFEEHLRATLAAYKDLGVKVYVLEGVPVFPVRATQIYVGLYRGNVAPSPEEANTYLRKAAVPRALHDERNAFFTALFSQLEGEGLITSFIKITDTFCDTAVCPIGEAQQSYYTDRDHLSLVGAHKLEPVLKAPIKAISNASK